LHGGRIWVQSELGVGSTFTVLLPIADRKLPPSLLDQLPAGAQKILVVDDERDIVALLRHQLETKGYKVVIASTGEQAIAKAIAEQPSLITLDILLPDRNGFDVLRELKARPETAHIPVIVLSVVQDETSGYKLGAAGYITKPVDKQLLVSSVSHILGQKGKVLVAEDDKDTAEMLVKLLESHHLQTFHAVDGYETLSIARRERPGLILLDLRMPGMDGYEALTRLKKDPETRKIPILVMSAHAVDTIQERAKLQKMGAYDFFPKPFDLDELMEEIAQMGNDSQELNNDTSNNAEPETE
jgi:CheY-like chemotaxis protein